MLRRRGDSLFDWMEPIDGCDGHRENVIMSKKSDTLSTNVIRRHNPSISIHSCGGGSGNNDGGLDRTTNGWTDGRTDEKQINQMKMTTVLMYFECRQRLCFTLL